MGIDEPRTPSTEPPPIIAPQIVRRPGITPDLRRLCDAVLRAGGVLPRELVAQGAPLFAVRGIPLAIPSPLADAINRSERTDWPSRLATTAELARLRAAVPPWEDAAAAVNARLGEIERAVHAIRAARKAAAAKRRPGR